MRGCSKEAPLPSFEVVVIIMAARTARRKLAAAAKKKRSSRHEKGTQRRKHAAPGAAGGKSTPAQPLVAMAFSSNSDCGASQAAAVVDRGAANPFVKNTSVNVFSQFKGQMMNIAVGPGHKVIEVKHMIVNAYFRQIGSPAPQVELPAFKLIAAQFVLEMYDRKTFGARCFDDDSEIVDDVDSDWFFCMYTKDVPHE